MKERPISFRGDMVRAILEGRKTQTRRVAKEIVERERQDGDLGRPVKLEADGSWSFPNGGGFQCPYGELGDRLWVREALEKGRPFDDEVFDGYRYTLYAADGEIVRDDGPFAAGWRWKRDNLPSIFCPRACSRITLEVTGVRVERVQEITLEEVELEGVDVLGHLPAPAFMPPGIDDGIDLARDVAISLFSELWDEINAKRGYPWSDNPWVWVVEFRRLGG